MEKGQRILRKNPLPPPDYSLPAHPREINVLNYQFPIENEIKLVSAIGGAHINTYEWPAEGKLRGVIIAFHAGASYIGQYGHMAKQYAKIGFTFVGSDNYGYGKSGGIRGAAHPLEKIEQDHRNFISKVKAKFGTAVPYIGWGLSGGVASALLTHVSGLCKFNALVYCAPGCTVHEKLLFVYKQFFKTYKDKPLDPMFPMMTQTDPWLDRYYLRDPYFNPGPMLAGPCCGLQLTITENTQELYEKTDVPVFMTVVENEYVADNEWVLNYCRSFKDKRSFYKTYPGDHYLMFDGAICWTIIEDQCKWLDGIFNEEWAPKL